MTRRLGGWFYGAALLVLVAGALVTVWLLTRGASTALADLDPAPVPVGAPVSEATIDYAADATLSATLGEGPELLASGVSGTVTAVSVLPGQEITAGATVYSADGVPVVAYSGDTVLYRALQVGDQGEDVRTAQALLGTILGREVPTDGKFRESTAAAVRAYERSLGVTQPAGILQPTWFTHLPAVPFVVDSVDVQLGQPAPAAGEVVVTGVAGATGFTLATESAGPAGDYVLVSPGHEVPLTRAADGTWQVTDPASASALVLSGQVSDGAASATGRVRMLTGESGQSVPGAAVVTDAAEATCVALADSEKLVAVTVAGSGVDGSARILPVLDSGAVVLVNPWAVLGDVTCPSS